MAPAALDLVETRRESQTIFYRLSQDTHIRRKLLPLKRLLCN